MIQGNLALEKSAVPISRSRKTSSMISVSRQKVKNRIQSLAEAVILQAIEDLFDPSERKKSIAFFKSENFSLCAETAGLSTLEQIRIIRMLAKAGFQQYFYEVHNSNKTAFDLAKT
jgi:hypothetical protein